jgi:2-hydroxychromene-2-carboxylate isomerase
MRALTALNPDELRGGAEKVFHAYWGEGRDVSDPSLLIELLGADVVEMASADQVKQKLRATTDDAISRGAFGAPTFFVGDQLFFGNDRLDFIEDLLMKQD